MNQYSYTITSEGGRLKSQVDVGVVLDEYFFPVAPSVEDGVISFHDEAGNEAFDVFESSEMRKSVVEEFLQNLAPYLSSQLEVVCTESEGERDVLWWKWSVSPDGTVEHTDSCLWWTRTVA